MIRLITSVFRVPAAADAVQALQQLSLQKKLTRRRKQIIFTFHPENQAALRVNELIRDAMSWMLDVLDSLLKTRHQLAHEYDRQERRVEVQI